MDKTTNTQTPLTEEESLVKTIKAMVNKAGGNASKNAKNYRVTIPPSWAKELGIVKNEEVDDRDITLTFDKEQKAIIIKKA